jgi:hypothetical protein
VALTAIGAFGRRRRFEISGVKDVRVEDRPRRDPDGDHQRKRREGDSIRFGATLEDERWKFVAAAVREALVR